MLSAIIQSIPARVNDRKLALLRTAKDEGLESDASGTVMRS